LKHKNSTIFALSKDGRGENPTQREEDGKKLPKSIYTGSKYNVGEGSSRVFGLHR